MSAQQPSSISVRRRRDAVWFATSTRRRRLLVQGSVRWALVGVVHARQVGDRATVCGIEAVEWPMVFYTPFDPRSPASCESCRQRLI